MKNPVIILLAILVAIVGFLMWWFSPTQVVKRQINTLVETLNIAADDGKATRASKNQDFSTLLGEKFAAELNASGMQRYFTKDDAIEAHLALISTCQSCSLSMSNLVLDRVNDSTFRFTCKADASVSLKGGDSQSESGKLTIIWEKTENSWVMKDLLLTAP